MKGFSQGGPDGGKTKSPRTSANSVPSVDFVVLALGFEPRADVERHERSQGMAGYFVNLHDPRASVGS
jgi:hypothetical protein